MADLLFGRFEPLSELGAGGMGTVLHVRCQNTQADYALKWVSVDRTTDLNLTTRFRREFRALSRLDHPNIVKVHEFLEDEEGLAFVMDLVKGDTLLDAFRRRWPTLDRPQAGDGSLITVLGWFIQLLTALGQVHRTGLVHRDIKPANILVNDEGRVFLTDFGLAVAGERRRDPQSDVTREGHIVGTLTYIAPEQARGQSPDHRADLYAVGVMMYELFTGQHPFAHLDGPALIMAQIGEHVPRPRMVAPQVPTALEKLILDCLAKEPHQRPPFAEEVAAALEKIRHEITAATDRPTEDHPPEPGAVVPARPARAMLLTPRFVGREAEQETATSLLTNLERGLQPAFVMVIEGESGLGKTRFLREVAQAARLRGLVVCEAPSTEQDRTAFGTISAAAAQLFRQHAAAVGDNQWRNLGAWLPSLGLTGPPEGSERRSPESVRGRGLQALTQLATAAGRGKGLLVCLDDAQWLDKDSAQVWAHLVRTLAGAAAEADDAAEVSRIGVIMAARTDLRPGDGVPVLTSRGLHVPMRRVRLGPFTEDETIQFVQLILGQRHEPRNFGRRIHAETGGNPFFIEETLKMLVEEGTLEYDARRDDPWTVKPELARDAYRSLSLPESVAQVFTQRLKDLSPEEKRFLLFAACIGQRFHFESVVQSAHVPQETALDMAGRFLSRGLVVEDDIQGDWYAFKQDKLREHLVNEAGERRVRQVHSRILDVLAGNTEWCASPDPREDLALHALHAERDEEALQFITSAAVDRYLKGHVDHAFTLFKRAAETLDRLADVTGAEHELQRLEILRHLVACGTLLGRHPDVEPLARAYVNMEAARRGALPDLDRVVTRLATSAPILDPAFTRHVQDTDACTPIHRGLVAYHPMGVVVPDVAKSWELTDDGLVYTFHLHDGATFHDGSKLTSADVLASFRRVLDPATGSNNHWVLLPISGSGAYRAAGAATGAELAGLEAPDPRTVRITLDNPLPFFLHLLTLDAANILPEAARKQGIGPGDLPVGCGPFRAVERTATGMVLERHDGYPGRARVKVRRLEIQWGSGGPAETLRRFDAGELTYLPDWHGTEGRERLHQADFRGVTRAGLGLCTHGVGIDCGDGPFRDPRVRQALAWAVDREALVRATQSGVGQPARGVLPPGMLGHDPESPGFGYRPEMARRLLREAGFGDGIDCRVVRPQRRPGEAEQPFDVFSEMLREVGVRVSVEYLSDDEYNARAAGQGNGPLFMYGWRADYPDPDAFFFPLFHSRLGEGIGGGWSHPEADRMIETGRHTADNDRRATAYRLLTELLLKEVPFIPLYHHRSMVVYDPARMDVAGVGLSVPLLRPDDILPPRAP